MQIQVQQQLISVLADFYSELTSN